MTASWIGSRPRFAFIAFVKDCYALRALCRNKLEWQFLVAKVAYFANRFCFDAECLLKQFSLIFRHGKRHSEKSFFTEKNDRPTDTCDRINRSEHGNFDTCVSSNSACGRCWYDSSLFQHFTRSKTWSTTYCWMCLYLFGSLCQFLFALIFTKKWPNNLSCDICCQMIKNLRINNNLRAF